MKINNIGIIGYGGYGQFICNAITNHKSAKVIAISDFKKPITIPYSAKYYKEYKELLLNNDIDIVWIATPPNTHAELAISALQMGKHVIVEKPMAISLEDCQRVIKVANQEKKYIAVDFMLRSHPFIQAIKRWYNENVFGNLRRVFVENYAQDELLSKSHLFWDKSKSGGILIEHGIHFIDIVNYICNSKPLNISGYGCRNDEKQEDQVICNILYENNIITTHYHDFSRPGFFEETTITFVFDLGKIILSGWIPQKAEILVLTNKSTIRKIQQTSNIHIYDEQLISNIENVSRPKGWGNVYKTSNKNQIKSGGNYYTVDRLNRAKLELTSGKDKIYKQLIRQVLEDFTESVNSGQFQNSESILESHQIAIEGQNRINYSN